MANKHNSLLNTKWLCKYHIVFTPKYRRKIEFNQYKQDIVNIIQRLCKYKGVEIIEGHIMPDHIHLLLSIPPKYSVSSFMGYLKGKSSLMIFDMHSNLKYKYGNRKFWAEGYCKCQNKSVNKFQDKNVQKIYNIDILKKGDIYDIRNKNTN